MAHGFRRRKRSVCREKDRLRLCRGRGGISLSSGAYVGNQERTEMSEGWDVEKPALHRRGGITRGPPIEMAGRGTNCFTRGGRAGGFSQRRNLTNRLGGGQWRQRES